MDGIRRKAIEVLDEMIMRGSPKWKPGKDISHLHTRKNYSHIPDDWTLDDYNNHIMSIIKNIHNETYLYFVQGYRQNFFVFGDTEWIVMVGEDGIMETSFPPDDYYGYLIPEKGYCYLGTIEEVRRNEF